MLGFISRCLSRTDRTNQKDLTKENIKEYKAIYNSLQGTKATCTAMYHITNEAIYRQGISTMKDSMQATKKVLRHGACAYSPGSRVAKDIEAFQKHQMNAKTRIRQISIKMHPSRAEEILFDWLKEDEELAREVELEKAKEAEEKAKEAEEKEKAAELEANNYKAVLRRVGDNTYVIDI